jgi:hypothetical protein
MRVNGTQYKPLAIKQTQPAMLAHDIICAHTMVGFLATTYEMFLRNGYGGTESHLGIGGVWGADIPMELDGVAYQFQDLMFSADANFEGSRRIISIETADNAPKSAKDLQPWTPKQLSTLITLMTRMCSLDFHQACPPSWRCHQGTVWDGVLVAIPPALVPDSRPGRRGLAFHRQGIDPWRVSEGEHWSVSNGKECPGDQRIWQLVHVVIPAVQANIKGNTVNMEEQDVETTDKLMLGPGNQALLGQKDAVTTVGEAMIGAWAGHRETQKFLGGKLDSIKDTQDKELSILAEIRDGQAAQTEALQDLAAAIRESSVKPA